MTKNKIHEILRSNLREGKRFINGNRMIVIRKTYSDFDDQYGSFIYEMCKPGEENLFSKDLEVAVEFLYEGRKEVH